MGVDGGSSRSASSCRSPPPPTTTPRPGRRRPGPSVTPTSARTGALWEKNYSVYGRRKLWKAAKRPDIDVGRDQVARLMREQGICGATRAKKRFTTKADPAARPGPGPGEPGLHRHPARRPVGGRLHLLLDVVGHRLRGLHHRRLLPTPGRLEGGPLDDRRPGGRRPEHGRLDPAPHQPGRTDLPHRRGIAIHLDCLHRPDRRGRSRPFHRDGRRQLRQRHGRIGHGHLQDRAAPQPCRPGRQRRTLEGPRRPRDRHLRRGCRGSTRSACTPNSTTGRRPSSKPTTVTSLSPMRHERTKRRVSGKLRPVHEDQTERT